MHSTSDLQARAAVPSGQATNGQKLSWEKAEPEISEPAGGQENANTIGDLFVGTFYVPW